MTYKPRVKLTSTRCESVTLRNDPRWVSVDLDTETRAKERYSKN